jgi:hypothetical protein
MFFDNPDNPDHSPSPPPVPTISPFQLPFFDYQDETISSLPPLPSYKSSTMINNSNPTIKTFYSSNQKFDQELSVLGTMLVNKTVFNTVLTTLTLSANSALFQNSLTVLGDAFINNLILTRISILDTIKINNLRVESDLIVTGNQTNLGNMTITNSIIFNNIVDINNLSILNNFTVSNLTSSGDIIIKTDFINTNLTVLGNVLFNNANISTMTLPAKLAITNLESTDSMTITSSLTANIIDIDGIGYFENLEVDNIDFGSNTKLQNVTVTSNIFVFQNQYINGNLFINGGNIIANNGTFTNLSKESGITVLDTAFYSNLYINGDQYIQNIFNVDGTAYSSNLISSSLIVDNMNISNLSVLDDGLLNNGDMTIMSQLYIQNTLFANQINNTTLNNISQLTTFHLYANNQYINGTEIINGNLFINQPNTTAFISTNIATSLSIMSSLNVINGIINSNLVQNDGGLGSIWNFTNLTISGNMYWNSGIVNINNAIISNIATTNATFLSAVIQTSISILSNLQINSITIGGNLVSGTSLFPNIYTTNITTMQTTPVVLSQVTILSNLITINGNEFIATNGNLLFNKTTIGSINQYIGTKITVVSNGSALLGNITAINEYVTGNKLVNGDLTALTITANYLQGTSLSNLSNINLPYILCNNLSVIGGNQTIASVLYMNPSSIGYIPTILATNMTVGGTGNVLANTVNITQLNANFLTTSNLTITNQANIYRYIAGNFTGILNKTSSVLATNFINYGGDVINNVLLLTNATYNYMTNAYFNIVTNTNLIVSNLTSANVISNNINIQNANNAISSINLLGNTEIITILNPFTNLILQNTGFITGNITNNGNLLVQQNMKVNQTSIIPQMINTNLTVINMNVSNISNLVNENKNIIYGNESINNSLIVQNVAQMSNVYIANLSVLSNMILVTNQISNLSVFGSEYIQSNLTVFGTIFATNAQFSNLTTIRSAPITTITVTNNLIEGYGANSYNQKTIQSNLFGQVTSTATMSNLQLNVPLFRTMIYTNLVVNNNITILGSEQVNNMTVNGSVIGTMLKTTGLIGNNIQTSNLLVNGTMIVSNPNNEIVTNLTATLANINKMNGTNLTNTNIIVTNNATILSHISPNAETILGNLSIYQTTPITYTNLTGTNMTILSNLYNNSTQLPYINSLLINTLQLTNTNLTGINYQSLLGTDSNGFITTISGSANTLWQLNTIAKGIYKTLIDVSNTSSILVNIYPDNLFAQIQNTALSSLAQWQITDRGMTNVGGVQISVLTNFAEVYVSNNTIGTNITSLAPTTISNNIALNANNGNLIVNGNYSSNNMGMYRNRVINGGMVVNQRNVTSANITTSTPYTNRGVFLVDRFSFNYSISSGSAILSQLTLLSSDTPSNYGLTNGLRCSMVASLVLPTTGYFFGNYKMPYEDISDFNWGTVEGIPITLSFWCRSSLPKNWINIINNQAATKYNYISTYLVTAGTWNYVSVSIPPPPTGSVWSTAGLLIGFNKTGGSAVIKTTTYDQWQTTSPYPTITAGENPTLINNYFDITGLQLEKGTIATPFQIKPYSVELDHCLYYYEIVRYQAGQYDQITDSTTGLSIRLYKKKMRNKRSDDATSVILTDNLGETLVGMASLTPAYTYNFLTFNFTLGASSSSGYYRLTSNSNIELNDEIPFI